MADDPYHEAQGPQQEEEKMAAFRSVVGNQLDQVFGLIIATQHMKEKTAGKLLGDLDRQLAMARLDYEVATKERDQVIDGIAKVQWPLTTKT